MLTDNSEKEVFERFCGMCPGLRIRAIWTMNGETLWTRVVVDKADSTGVKMVVNMKSLVVKEHKPPRHEPGMRSWTVEEEHRTECATLEECASVVRAFFA